MKSSRRRIFSVLIFSTFAGCRNPRIAVPRVLRGSVIDSQTKAPIAGALVTTEMYSGGTGSIGPEGVSGRRVWKTLTATTDSNGLFEIDFEEVYRRYPKPDLDALTVTEVRVTKQGYVPASAPYSGSAISIGLHPGS